MKSYVQNTSESPLQISNDQFDKLNKSMKSLREEINNVITNENIDGISFVRLNKWQWVLEKIANSFLNQGQKVLEKTWLWEHINEPYNCYQPLNTLIELENILDLNDSYWFIASDEKGKYWVLQGKGQSIITLLSESCYIEYYISDIGVNWIICENHHGVLYIKGDIN